MSITNKSMTNICTSKKLGWSDANGLKPGARTYQRDLKTLPSDLKDRLSKDLMNCSGGVASGDAGGVGEGCDGKKNNMLIKNYASMQCFLNMVRHSC